MQDNKLFIEVEKVTLNTKEGKISVVSDTLRITDIKNFRKWIKSDIENAQVDGEMTQISVVSSSASEGFYNIRIKESWLDFSKRLGGFVIEVNKK